MKRSLFASKIQRYIVLILALHFVVLASAQERRYSFDFRDVELKVVLREISEKSAYKFAYNDSEINANCHVSLSVRNYTIRELLDVLESRLSLQAEFVGSTIVLKSVELPAFYVVEGRVRDSESKRALGWVNVSSSDKKSGTLTDSSGYFCLKLDRGHHEINFSYVGFENRVVQVSEAAELDIALQAQIHPLKELVVVAFGEENKELIGGSVSLVDPKVFSQLNNNSLNSVFQNSSPGVQVQNNAGTPGSAINVLIRGLGSITAGNSPLYILDGIPIIRGNFSQLNFSGQTLDALSDINVNDIESMSILKDAAAASLYGASASNGVVLITTKQGTGKRNQIFVDSYYGFQETSGKLSLLNAKEWMHLKNEDAADRGRLPVYTSSEIQNNKVDTDWLDKVFRVAPTYNFYLSLRGGEEKYNYYISTNYFNQDGIVIGSDFSRYSFRVNYDYKFSKRLSFEVGNGFSSSLNNRVEGDQSLNGPLPVAISMPSIYPVYNSNGTYNNEGPYANPVSIAMDEKNLATTYRNIFSIAFNYRLLSTLRFRTQVGFDYYHLGEQTFAPKITRQGAKYNGLGIEATNNASLFYNSSYLVYSNTFAKHFVSVQAGGSMDRYRSHGTYLRAQNFPGSSFQFLQDAATPIVASSDEEDAVSNSLFASLKYNYDEIYVFSVNIRRDGSSKFGKNNRFGYFPAVSALWNIWKEDFWRSDSRVNRLKLRGSYGLTGNDQISNFISLDLFAAGSNYNYEAGIRPYQLSNPDLKWETTSQYNVGVEMELFSALQLTIDYYHRRTKDLLLEVPVPTSTGFSYFLSNVGMLQNQGLELELSSMLLKNKFTWESGLSFSSNHNKVLQLYNDQPIRNIGRASSSIEVGEPVSYFYGFLSNGVDRETGDLIYEDIHSDGVINDLDRTKIGNPFPLFFGGFMNSFSYRGFSLDLLLYYSYGNDIFNSTRLYTETLSIGNQTTAILDRWRSNGDNTEVPRASSYNELISSRFVEDGSYLRLKNLKLSYQFELKNAKSIALDGLQVYIAAKNLFTLTNYSGMDPEVNYSGSGSLRIGTDFFTCPQAKTYILGICAKF